VNVDVHVCEGRRVDVHVCEGGGEWMSMGVRGEESGCAWV